MLPETADNHGVRRDAAGKNAACSTYPLRGGLPTDSQRTCPGCSSRWVTDAVLGALRVRRELLALGIDRSPRAFALAQSWAIRATSKRVVSGRSAFLIPCLIDASCPSRVMSDGREITVSVVLPRQEVFIDTRVML